VRGGEKFGERREAERKGKSEENTLLNTLSTLKKSFENEWEASCNLQRHQLFTANRKGEKKNWKKGQEWLDGVSWRNKKKRERTFVEPETLGEGDGSKEKGRREITSGWVKRLKLKSKKGGAAAPNMWQGIEKTGGGKKGRGGTWGGGGGAVRSFLMTPLNAQRKPSLLKEKRNRKKKRGEK